MTKKNDENQSSGKNPGATRRTKGKKPGPSAEKGLKQTKRVATDAAKTAKEALASGAADLADQTRETAEQTAETVGDGGLFRSRGRWRGC